MINWYYRYQSGTDKFSPFDWLEKSKESPLHLHDRKLGPVKDGTPKEAADLLIKSGFSPKNTLRIVRKYMGCNRREGFVPNTDLPLGAGVVPALGQKTTNFSNHSAINTNEGEWEMPSDNDKLYDTPLAMAAKAAAAPVTEPAPVEQVQKEDPRAANLRKVIEAYIATRDELKARKKAYEDSIAELKQYQENRELWMQQQLNEMGVSSAKTDAGTSYKKMTRSATVADQQEFLNWVLESPAERIACMDVKASVSTIGEMVEDGKLVPPGVNWKTFEKVMVRR